MASTVPGIIGTRAEPADMIMATLVGHARQLHVLRSLPANLVAVKIVDEALRLSDVPQDDLKKEG